MSNFIVPYIFVPGTKAKAQEVNSNFSAIQNELNLKVQKSGDENQTFSVANAIEETHAMNKSQVEGLIENLSTNVSKEISKKVTPFCILSGNVNNSGNPDLFEVNGLSLTFKVGGNYPNLKAINSLCEIFDISSIENFSFNGYINGTYNLFIDKSGKVSAIANNIFTQRCKPTMAINDVWVDISSEPLKVVSFNGTTNEIFEKVFIGKIIVTDSTISAIYCANFNDNGYNVNKSNNHVIIETYKNGNSWYRLYSDGWIEQGGSGVLYTNKYHTVYFLKPYKDVTYHVNALGNSTIWDYADNFLACQGRTTDNFIMSCRYMNATGYVTYNWEAKGYGK